MPLKFKDHASVLVGTYLPVITFYIALVWCMFVQTDLVSGLVAVTIYGAGALWYWSWEYPPKWYCRLKWGIDKPPYYKKIIFTKKQYVWVILTWPLWGGLLTAFIVTRDLGYYVYKLFKKVN